MSASKAEKRERLRPQGLPSLGCDGCQFKSVCGGYYSGTLFGTCFDELCCEYTGKPKELCNAVCPYKSDFVGWLSDAGGLRFDDLPEMVQEPISLPLYVPMIDHRSSRAKPLDWPAVALNTYSVLRMRRNRAYRAIADSPEGLREAYLVKSDAQVILRGVADDPPLEKYWENRQLSNAPSQLAKLGVTAAIGPNFSHFLDVPRTDHIYNKRRQLLCLQELVAAGLNVVPHLNSVSPGDWVFWTNYLRTNPQVCVVAIEFQTGHKAPREGRKVLNHLAAAQKEIGRPLHLILVGGAQFLEYAAVRFRNITLIDSTPFHKAMHRSFFDKSRAGKKWADGFTLQGQKLDEFLQGNVAAYNEWLLARVHQARQDANRPAAEGMEKS